MPMPAEYKRAQKDFDAFLAAVMDQTGLTTRNQAYTTAQAVFSVFREHAGIIDVLTFADALPPLVRSLLLTGWRPGAEPKPFGDEAALVDAVRSLRRHHNFSPDTAIADVAAAVREVCDARELDAALGRLSADSSAFWRAG